MRTRHFVLVGGLLALSASSSAMAQDAYDNVSLQMFNPNAGTTLNYNSVSGADTLGHLRPTAGLWLNYAHRPLTATLGDGTEIDLVSSQLGGDLVLGIGLGSRFQLGLAVPLTLNQSVGSADGTNFPMPTLTAFALGDMRLVPRFALLQNPEGLNLSLEAVLGLPVGDKANLNGNGGVTVEPRVLAELKANERTRFGLNLGYRIRSNENLYNLTIGNELTYGIGAAYALTPDKLTLLAELFGKLALDGDSEGRLETSPLEANVALRFNLASAHAVTVGAGPGLTNGYGTPTFRAFLGYAFTPAAYTPPPDKDNDGIVDKEDGCPAEAEDMDSFQDADGCPDLDNDSDGIPDTADKCPNDAEDKDNFQDEDGCPDKDNDADGVLDANDKCPDNKEDHDGMYDDDGCLDPDNDQDGLLDQDDKCPNKAEDKDGLGDEDGCPEDDFDKDGVLDTVDQCPRKAEVINGVKDDDGCPDEGKAQVVLTKERVEILEQVYFDTAKDTIQKRSFNLLNQVAQVLKANPEITKLRIEGHTDNVGDDASNLDLSKRRAASVMKYLVDAGVDGGRMVSEGYGETQPVADNKTDKGRQLNRRVVFTIIELEGRPVEAKTIEKTVPVTAPAAPAPAGGK